MCQKLSNSVEIWQSSDKIKLGHFLAHPVYAASKKLIKNAYARLNKVGQTLDNRPVCLIQQYL